MTEPDSAEELALQQYITELETQLADTTRQHNEEIRGLANEVAHLQSQLEQGETERQTLNYQLTLAQRENRQCNAQLAEREKQWETVQTSLQNELTKLSRQCQDWNDTLDAVQEARAQERTQSQQILAAKENQLSVRLTQCEDLLGVKNQLESDIEESKRMIHELCVKLQHAEEDIEMKRETIQKQSCDLEEKVKREGSLEQDIKNMLNTIKSLEAELEVERSALQDAKFSHDVSQLRLKEMERNVEEERAINHQLAADLSELKETVSRLKHSLEEQEKRGTLLRDQLESKDSACRSLEHQSLQQQAVISDLSHQLQLSKSNLDALSEELNLCKQRRSMSEEKYTGSMREVESLIDQFRVQITKEQQPPIDNTQTKSKGNKSSGVSSPSQVPEKLRVTLIEFRALHEAVKVQYGTTKSQLSNVRQHLKQLSAECSTYREIVTARTSAITEADKQLGESAQEISKLNKQLAHSQAKSSSLKKEMDALQQSYEQERDSHHKTQEELDLLRKDHRNDTEEHCRFLSLLREQLSLTSLSVPSESSSGLEQESSQSWPSTSTPLRQPVPIDWDGLSKSVSAGVLALCEAFKQSKREVKNLKLTAAKLKSTLESTRAMHKDTTCRLTMNHEEQENQWSKRNEQLKANFEALVAELENKVLHLQQKLDMTLQDASQLDQARQQLESQLKQLRETHRVYKNDRACLLSCTCLFAGSLFPALQRLQELSLQKAVLLKQLTESEKLRESVVEVSNSIRDHIGVHVEPHSEDIKESGFPDSRQNLPQVHPLLLKFRKAVIAVLVIRRFQMIQSEKNVLFCAKFPKSVNYVFQIPVHIGIKENRTPDNSPTVKTSSAASRHSSGAPKPSGKDLASWMRSEKALVEVRESFSHLQIALDSYTSQQQHQKQHWPTRGHGLRKREKGAKDPYRTTPVLRPARIAFEAALEKMSSHFPHMKNSTGSSIVCSDSLVCLRLRPKSLCYRLARGLLAILKNKSHPVRGYSKSAELGDQLHSQIISLVERLHQSELQQHSLRSQLIQSKSNCDNLSRQLQEAGEMKGTVESLQAELGMMIPRGQFEAICKDLEESLKREKELKAYLSQHASVAEQLQAKLQLATRDVQSKDSSLSQSKKELHDLRLNLQHKEHQLSAVSKQLELVDREKLAQAQQVGELQTALAVCRKQMVHEVMSESQTQQSKLHDDQSSSPSKSYVPLKQLGVEGQSLRQFQYVTN